MEKQVKDLYIISKSKEIQQELRTPMYCDILDFMGLIYKINESYGQGKKKKSLRLFLKKLNVKLIVFV